jgi:hypothetical protein
MNKSEKFAYHVFYIYTIFIFRVQRGLVGIARWLAVRQARVRISARHPMEVPLTEPTAIEEEDMEMSLSECL